MDNLKILKQLEEGKISAEEAMAMMGQQKPPVTPTFESPPPVEQPPTGWVDSFVGWVGDVVNDVATGIKDLTISYDTIIKVFESRSVSQGINRLVLVGKNAKVKVRGYDGDTIRVECEYNARREDAEVYFHEESGVFKLIYDEDIIRSMKITCEVPRVLIKDLLVASKNDKILVEGLTSSKIHVETKNAKITAENICADTAIFRTKNARIDTQNSNITHMYLSTTNTGLKFAFAGGWEGERTLEAVTTNGGIAIALPSDVGLNIEAETSNSKISCNRDDMNYSKFSKRYMLGESQNYNFGGKRMRVKLSTGNSSIKIL